MLSHIYSSTPAPKDVAYASSGAASSNRRFARRRVRTAVPRLTRPFRPLSTNASARLGRSGSPSPPSATRVHAEVQRQPTNAGPRRLWRTLQPCVRADATGALPFHTLRALHCTAPAVPSLRAARLNLETLCASRAHRGPRRSEPGSPTVLFRRARHSSRLANGRRTTMRIHAIAE